MLLSLKEVLDTCPDWLKFCEMKGFSEWAVNEGGGDVLVELTTLEAHELGIVKLSGWKASDNQLEI